MTTTFDHFQRAMRRVEEATTVVVVHPADEPRVRALIDAARGHGPIRLTVTDQVPAGRMYLAKPTTTEHA